jgi:hypothetical protein
VSRDVVGLDPQQGHYDAVKYDNSVILRNLPHERAYKWARMVMRRSLDPTVNRRGLRS